MCTIDYPKFIVEYQKEYSISIERVKMHPIWVYVRSRST